MSGIEAYEVYGWDSSNHRYTYILVGRGLQPKKVAETFSEMLKGNVPEEKPTHLRSMPEESWEYNKELAEDEGMALTNITGFVEVLTGVDLYTSRRESFKLNSRNR